MEINTWDRGWQLWDLMQFLNEGHLLQSGALYRGHASADWTLTPALYRRKQDIFGLETLEQRFGFIEQSLINTFFDSAGLLLPSLTRGPLIDRVIAQHYGVPTQLLDWTLDPLIALFFAVHAHDTTKDAALYYLVPTSICTIRSSLHFPYSGGLMKFKPPVIDSRISAQKSRFTIQRFEGENDFLPLEKRALKYSDKGQGTDPRDQVHSIGKIIIPYSRVAQIEYQLSEIGIDSSLVFPGLQGIGEKIAADVRLQKISDYH